MGYKEDFYAIEWIAEKLRKMEMAAGKIREAAVSLDKSFDYDSWRSDEGKALIQWEGDYTIDCALESLYKTLKSLEEAGLMLRHKGGWFGAATVGMPEGRRNQDWQEHCIQWEQYSIKSGRKEGGYFVLGRRPFDED